MYSLHSSSQSKSADVLIAKDLGSRVVPPAEREEG